ncbi:hypothetical protein GCM10008018_36650 [Paenibacillus marchantiophytorum]|uniref:Uncharacterized protein n=1 Tax=Paenibacillus marchantiophytorum TaxID=1619310 RepID=A0ABQ1EUF5_9BACL|nr:hypothetical protein [Paenibacillus marchantiophytorum]GFZ87156.1 hypothetical protein GCM10008018_36650 [Paenibacillus marchantiophytorum]
MAGIKTRLERTQKMVKRLEDEYRDALHNRINQLGYRLSEVLETFPIEKQAAKARLMVVLEYEEITVNGAMQLITEGHYACAFYPIVVIQYLHYLLDEIGVPPLDEIGLFRQLILEAQPDLKADFHVLERKWKHVAAVNG